MEPQIHGNTLLASLFLKGQPNIALIQMLGTQYYKYIINAGFDSRIRISPFLGYNKGDRILAKTEIGSNCEMKIHYKN